MFCYAYTALGDEQIKNIILLGPPCDYHAPGGTGWQNRMVSRQLKQVRKLTGWKVHGTGKRLWHTPGWANSLAFKMASPAGTVRGYTELLQRLDDRDFVAGHATHAAFLDDMVAYPGGVMQDIVQNLITDNVLAQGRLPLRECSATLADIKVNVLMVLGNKDPIVSPASSRRLLDLLVNANTEVLQVPGGHMSIVSGSQAPEAIWLEVADWLSPYS